MDKQEKKENSVKSEAIDELGSSSGPILILSDKEQGDEDAEANEDLSLKIAEKAMLQACSNVIDEEEAEILTNVKEVSGGIDKGFESFCSDMFPEDKVKEKENVDATEAMNIGDCTAEKNPAEVSDNAVLRRLLRGPRYFDTPDERGTCYNCGEEGHTAANCTSARRKKPCFVCGSFEHNAKQCAKGKSCFVCKKGGHRANVCPERSHGGSKSSKICLKCGDSGHDMFSCKNNYADDDLKEIQCYICMNFGHLCCAKYPDSGPRELSCYRCGLLGHTGLACTASRGETSGTGSLNPCYRCGEEGHFARECTNLSKVNKRNHESSTPKKKVQKKRKEQKEFRSEPRDFGRALKKKGKNEGACTSGCKVKQKVGWIPNDPKDCPQPINWRSPSTPINKRAKISNFNTGGNSSVSHSSRKSNRLDFDNSASYGSGNYHHHRFSASGVFDNSGNYHHHRFSASGVFDNSASYGPGMYHHYHGFSASGDFGNSDSYGPGVYHPYHGFSASPFGNISHDRWRRNNGW